MPLVKVELRAGKTPEYKKAILDGVHDALVQAIKIPEWDRNQRLYELNSENYEIPSNKSEDAVIIEITMFKGRTKEAKRQLYQNIVANLARSPGIEGNDIMIVINEPPLENWGIRGGKMPDEVDLGFTIEV
ncbi:MAG: tautomerase family protein [Candidatus Saccharibacteria bacterium]